MATFLKKVFSLLFFLLVFMFKSQLLSQVLSAGQITDTVQSHFLAGQSYALYLPEQYNNIMRWPVILIFDPSARGRAGIDAFIEAGRKYGFILACSNNSHNGPVSDNFTAATVMLKDVEERFNIDQRRIYAAGFSGGSRFAVTFAVKEKRIAGVLGCGAGLPNDRNYYPSFKSDFLYYGLVGSRDMNFIEMNDLPAFFNNQTRVTAFLRTFSGNHQWPDPELITGGVEWLILQAMNRKIIPADQNFLSNIENQTQNLINAQFSSGNQVDAIMYLRFAARDFQGTPFGEKMKKLLADSENSAEYHKTTVKWNKITANELNRRDKYLSYIKEILNSNSIPDSVSTWWKTETRQLIRLRDKGSPENSQMASRILNFISILCYDQGTFYFRNSLYAKAAFLFEICTMSDSENLNNYYNLARALAGSGKSQEAIDALSAAVNHGTVPRKLVESDPIFSKIRNDYRYKSLISRLK